MTSLTVRSEGDKVVVQMGMRKRVLLVSEAQAFRDEIGRVIDVAEQFGTVDRQRRLRELEAEQARLKDEIATTGKGKK